MPELPEVETIVQALKNNITGNKILKISVFDQRFMQQIEDQKIDLELPGKIINNIYRRGKGIVFQCSGFYNLLIQLGMTGGFKIVDPHLENGKHERYSFVLDSGEALSFFDIRKFGRIRSFFSDKPETYPAFLNNLGPEPFSENFHSEYLQTKTQNGHRTVKDFLLNQQMIAGIGNIYASEILFDAQIMPARKVLTLNGPECEKLVLTTRGILAKAIKAGGTTISDYKKLDGEEGKFKNELMVYGREGESCMVCQKKIIKIRQSNRSTFYCSVCQK